MFKLIAKATGFLAYFFITLEMLFMVTPFAVYYYSIDRPLLIAALSFPATAWLPAFFLPHLSSNILPNIGNLICLLALAGFVLSAFQLYHAKFTGRGVVRGGFYRHIRHPQYLLLGLAGLGLLITWPRFILLIIYINMLWFYYFLARSEERRMEARFGEVYREQRRRTWMFLPWEPGRFLQQKFFGWIRQRKVRVAASYICSLIVTTSAAFFLRGISLAVTSRTIVETEKIAAVSFQSMPERRLREIVQLAEAAQEVQIEKAANRWTLVQVMEGKGSAVHTLIDAGMTSWEAQNLNLTPHGLKLVFSQQTKGLDQQPFGPRTRWHPALVAEIDQSKVANVVVLKSDSFAGNPVMPLF
jgi:protein-S-isoprenylcysteine O-methyltransferase Ste14